MKGAKFILCMMVAMIFVFSNTIVFIEYEPYYERPDYPESERESFTTIRPDPPRNLTVLPFPDSPYATLPDPLEVEKTEYIEKWYGNKLGFNEGLVSSYRRLTYGGVSGSPAFHPDGTRIIYASQRDGGNHSDIWIMDLNGTNQTQLTFEDIHQSQPSFLYDGIHYMFVTPLAGGIEIWIKSLADNTTWSYDIKGTHPSPAPNNHIIFMSNCTQMVDMYFRDFTYLPEEIGGHWPHIDANGVFIASEDYRCNRYNQLLLSDISRNITWHLTNDSINHNDPAISPDGKLIVYDTYLSSPALWLSNLWLYNTFSDTNYHLTLGKVSDVSAEFGPDGEHIVFCSDRGNEGLSYDIWLITLEFDD